MGQEHVFCKPGGKLGKLQYRKIMACTLPVAFALIFSRLRSLETLFIRSVQGFMYLSDTAGLGMLQAGDLDKEWCFL